ncbi:MAG TPA: hypothetical protein VFI47_21100 [Acidimicrobiales bacterium]|nr:hypothetical protein [Acidimicrobiales bacterium]
MPGDGPQMVCFSEATRRAPWRIRRGVVNIPVRQAAGVVGGALVAAPAGALLVGLVGSWNLLAVMVALGAAAGGLAVTARPGGEPVVRHLWRAAWSRRAVVDYRGRKGRLYVGLCPVPVDEIARGDRVVLRSSAVEIDPALVGERGEILPGRRR